MKKKFRRYFSLVLAMSMAFCLILSTTVFAAGDNGSGDVTTEPELRSTCIAWDTDVTSGFGTTITLHLNQGYYSPYFKAGAVGNGNNLVYCTVTTPTGSTYPLGSVIADGSLTPSLYYTGTAPAGDYVFEFQGTDTGTTGFMAFIYY